MSSRLPFGFLLLITALLFAGGLGLLSQRKQTMLLRGDLDAARGAAAELTRLHAENQRLHAQQIPATELATLRADHAAVVRLRTELEALRNIPPAK